MRELVRRREILVCVGPGGVGKTTTAAALGVLAARTGRRTLVCTIDPAPRLADALGLHSLGPEPIPVSQETSRALGIEGPGRLEAARVDTARAFDQLVEEVADPALRQRILSNHLYRHLTNDLTGAQEYAATLSLFELQRRHAHDIIVLDTPPAAHALDFLQAPQRLAEAIGSPALRWFARPDPHAGRFSWQSLRAGGALAMRRMGRLVGSQFLDDLGDFLLDVQGVLGAFLARSQEIERLLRRPEVAFLLVLSPEVAAIDEAIELARRLREAGTPLTGFIANRVLDMPVRIQEGDIAARLAGVPALRGRDLQEPTRIIGELAAYLASIAQAQRTELARLASRAPGLNITRVPLLARDVSNLDSLRAVADWLAAAATY